MQKGLPLHPLPKTLEQGGGLCKHGKRGGKLGFGGECNQESTGLKASLVQREVARECVTEGL